MENRRAGHQGLRRRHRHSLWDGVRRSGAGAQPVSVQACHAARLIEGHLRCAAAQGTAYPPPDLPFAVPENYIPTAPSMMKNLEDSLTAAIRETDAAKAQIAALTATVERLRLHIQQGVEL